MGFARSARHVVEGYLQDGAAPGIGLHQNLYQSAKILILPGYTFKHFSPVQSEPAGKIVKGHIKNIPAHSIQKPAHPDPDPRHLRPATGNETGSDQNIRFLTAAIEV